MRSFFEKYIALLLLVVLSTSCFTGIESTKKISDKDVAKVVQERGNTEDVSTAYNSVNVSNFPDWNVGKRFFVADNNIKRVFSPSSAYDVDTINLAERMLTYIGYTEGNVLDNEPNVNIRFTDGVHEYLYPTKKNG